MDNNKPEQSAKPDKKEIRKQLADKIAAAIPELKTTLGEKKFQHRIKKAVKHLTEGMYKKEPTTLLKKAKAAPITPAKKIATKKVKAAKKAKV